MQETRQGRCDAMIGGGTMLNEWWMVMVQQAGREWDRMSCGSCRSACRQSDSFFIFILRKCARSHGAEKARRVEEASRREETEPSTSDGAQ